MTWSGPPPVQASEKIPPIPPIKSAEDAAGTSFDILDNLEEKLEARRRAKEETARAKEAAKSTVKVGSAAKALSFEPIQMDWDTAQVGKKTTSAPKVHGLHCPGLEGRAKYHRGAHRIFLTVF